MKGDRQKKIIELIQTYAIDTQEELAQKLRDAGFDVTQATVSRDIRKLKITKAVDRDGKQRYAISEDEEHHAAKYSRVFKESFVDVQNEGNMVVIHTFSGMAMATATSLDKMKLQGLLGCIAGDDTIFCVCKTEEDAAALAKTIKELAY